LNESPVVSQLVWAAFSFVCECVLVGGHGIEEFVWSMIKWCNGEFVEQKMCVPVGSYVYRNQVSDGDTTWA